MVKLLVVADDLTGACDTGAQFAKRGIPTIVTTDPSVSPSSLDPSIAVLVVDTDSRHAPPEKAAVRVGDVTVRACTQGVTHFYKKTDSTLRGNIGAELTAMALGARKDVLFYAPAYPKAQRFTRGGRQYVGDRLLQDTQFGRDPRHPVAESSVAAIIGRQCDTPVTVAGREVLDETVAAHTNGICVCDAETDEDLRAVVAAIQAHHDLTCLAGSAGLAEMLPDILDLPRRRRSRPRDASPLFVVNGSLTDTALGQVSYALRHGFAGVHIPPEIALAEEPDRLVSALAVEQEAMARRALILYTARQATDAAAYVDYGRRIGLSAEEVHRRLSSSLGTVSALLAGHLARTLVVVFGGDTARAYMRAAGMTILTPLEELEPGLVVSSLPGALGHLVTKSGGFGEMDVVDTIKAYFAGGRRRAASRDNG